MGVDMDKMLDAPLVVIPQEQRNKAVMNVVWMNRDEPERIGEMLDALGLLHDARLMGSA